MSSVALGVLRLACLVALASSSALYLHYLDPGNSAFCGGESGCEAVRQSAIAYLGSRFVSLPLLGLLGFAGFLLLSLRQDVQLTNLWKLTSIVFGALGAALLMAQVAVIGQVCWLCVIVDIMAMASAVCGVALITAPSMPRTVLGLGGLPWLVLGVWFLVGPLGFAAVAPDPSVPAVVQARYQAGKVNVIELSDFECPYCRKLHPILHELLEKLGDEAHFERVHVPLAMHPHARRAALASICAERQGRERAMDAALFTEPLSEDLYERLAEQLGLDVKLFERCLKRDATDARLEEDLAFARAAGFQGLPTTFIGEKIIVGVADPGVYRAAAEGSHRWLTLPPSVYVAVWLVPLLVFVVWQRQRARAVGSPIDSPRFE